MVAYQEREGLDNDLLAARLGCDLDSLMLLGTLQLPAGGLAGLNVVYIHVAAAYTGIAPKQLATVLPDVLAVPAAPPPEETTDAN